MREQCVPGTPSIFVSAWEQEYRYLPALLALHPSKMTVSTNNGKCKRSDLYSGSQKTRQESKTSWNFTMSLHWILYYRDQKLPNATFHQLKFQLSISWALSFLLA